MCIEVANGLVEQSVQTRFTKAGAFAAIHLHDAADAGDRDRREYRDLQCHRRRSAETSAVHTSGRTGWALAHSDGSEHPRIEHFAIALFHLSRREPDFPG